VVPSWSSVLLNGVDEAVKPVQFMVLSGELRPEPRSIFSVNLVPFVIPLGASTPLGAAAFVSAVDELLTQIDPPDFIVHSTSSGGTQAGLLAGCSLARLDTNLLGISADDSAASLGSAIRTLLTGLAPLLGVDPTRFDAARVDVDDAFVGGGYGVPTDASREALQLLARCDTGGVDSDREHRARGRPAARAA